MIFVSASEKQHVLGWFVGQMLTCMCVCMTMATVGLFLTVNVCCHYAGQNWRGHTLDERFERSLFRGSNWNRIFNPEYLGMYAYYVTNLQKEIREKDLVFDGNVFWLLLPRATFNRSGHESPVLHESPASPLGTVPAACWCLHSPLGRLAGGIAVQMLPAW